MRKLTFAASSLTLALLAMPLIAQAQATGDESGTSTTAPKMNPSGDTGVNSSAMQSQTSKKAAEIRSAPPGAVGSGVSNKPSATTPTTAAQ